ncbi:MAG: DMT family transporter [Burkholderiaceae bacterium]|jgi:drug/metabolite transporter (DMT)-like permease|nr:DMT family transporter [Burkholderiaceae bacterium]
MLRPALIPPVLAIAWGLNWPAVKTMLTVIPPFSARALGLGLGVLLLAGLALLRRTPLWPQRAAWPAIWVGGLLTVAVFNICTAFAQLTTSTSRAAVLTFTMPLMSAALAWWLLGDRPDRRSRVALGLGGLGVACLALPVLQALAAAASGAARTPLWGLLLPLGAALAWALGTVATKRWPPPGDRIVLTAWQLGIGAAVAAVAALAAGEHLPTVWPLRVQVALAWHVLIATAVAYVLWYRLLASATATVSSLTTLAVPVVGVLGAMALVGDRPSATDWVGFVLVLGGAALAMVRVTRPAA